MKPSVSDSNSMDYRVVFPPSDADNYNTVETDITLIVNKAGNAPNMPSSTMNVANSCEKVSDVTLPIGWVWQDADKNTELTVGTAVTATAEYNGADKGNYVNETVSVSITRSACDHAHTEVRNAKAATCKETGYTGDTYCTDCGELLTTGTTIPLADHQGGTATCTKKAVCTVCGQEYGELNANNHVHTEIRGAVAATCTAGGYTGDTYCTDCGVKTKTGTATPALGHNYTSKVTTEPTTDREGVRTYTCDRCGHSYTESIPKLNNGGSSGGGNNGGGSSSGGSSSGGSNGGGSSTGGSSEGGNNGGNSSTGGSSSGGTEAGTGDRPENSGNTTTITNEDGSTTTTKTETDTNGNTVTTSTTVAADGSSTEKVQATETNTAGKGVAVTTTTKTDADGNVTSVTEKFVIEEAAKNTAVTVTTKADGSGEIHSAAAKITKTSSSSKVSLSGAVLGQISDVAGADTNVRISMTVKDTEGRTRYTVKADSDEITAGKKLYIYQLNTKTGKYTMVDNKEYEVTKAGTVTVNMTKKATYELVTAEESRAITKEILATVKPAKNSKSLPVKNTTTFKLSDMLDMDNIKRITYATSKKSVATVTKKGTIKAVKAGTATVKATVTIKNGTKKTIKMTIKVK